ncbi:MAG: M6 family metalloprotease domain-containing protein [Desulfobacterales bacterium]|nr:M6 family metalloprotease domain-containing protein [Desulfobacterales bacterium]
MKKVIVLWLVIFINFVSNSIAGPSCPDVIEITQPNGVKFLAEIKGDEFFNWIETENGYTIIRNQNSLFWEYAVLNEDNELVSSGVIVDPQYSEPAYIDKHLKAFKKNSKNSKGYSKQGTWTPNPVSGEKKLLIILVNFANRTLVTTAQNWYNSVFSTSSGVKSIANYYKDNSFSKLSVSPVTHTQTSNPSGVITVSLNSNHPNYGGNYTYELEKAWVQPALNAAANYVNFDALDTNSNGKVDTTEAVIYLIPAGYERSGTTKEPNVWAHAYTVSGSYELNVGSKKLQKWALNGELNHYDVQHPIGVIAHELGHSMCGLPDLYDISGTNQAMGYFSLMGSGSWCYDSGEYSGTTPSALDAWSRQFVGWTSPVIPTQNGQNLTFNHALSSANEVVKIINPSLSSQEYFLIENRYCTSWDRGLKRIGTFEGGLLIIHVDESPTTGYNDINDATEGTHQGVVPEQASTLYCDMLKNSATCRGHQTILFYSGNNNTFNDSSSPNSKYYSGVSSNMGLTNISSISSQMTAVFTNANSTSSLSVNPATKTVENISGIFTVAVTSNVSWTVTESATWLSVSPTSGTNNGSFTVNYDANTGNERSAIITVSGGGKTATVTVTQNAVSSLSVTPATKTVENISGTFNVTVTSNVSWTISEGSTWISVSPTSGINNGSFTVSYGANTGTERSAIIAVNGGGKTATVTVTQKAVSSLSVNPTTKTVENISGTFNVTVTSNVSWTISESSTWIIVSPISGTNNGSFAVNYGANTGIERSAIITISGGGKTATVTVNQNAVSSLSVIPMTKTVEKTSGTFDVTVTSNVNWTVTESSTWLSVSPTSGTNNAPFTVIYDVNTGDERSAIITVSGGGETKTVTVTQKSVNAKTSLVMPGVLLLLLDK